MSDENTVLVNDLHRLIKKYQAIRNIVHTLVVSIFIYKILKQMHSEIWYPCLPNFSHIFTNVKIGFAKNHCQTTKITLVKPSKFIRLYYLGMFPKFLDHPPAPPNWKFFSFHGLISSILVTDFAKFDSFISNSKTNLTSFYIKWH